MRRWLDKAANKSWTSNILSSKLAMLTGSLAGSCSVQPSDRSHHSSSRPCRCSCASLNASILLKATHLQVLWVGCGIWNWRINLIARKDVQGRLCERRVVEAQHSVSGHLQLLPQHAPGLALAVCTAISIQAAEEEDKGSQIAEGYGQLDQGGQYRQRHL